MFNIKNYSFILITIACLLFVNTNKVEGQNHPHHSEEKSSHNHSHKSIELSDNDIIPTMKIIVSPDQVKGWNLEIQTNNFVFKPENINQNSKINEGHGHLYINGEKITRIYSNWYHIPELPKGKNEIKVTLNTNLHEDLMYKGKVIQDAVIIQH